MNKKEELKRLLKEFTKDELMEIMGDSEEAPSFHKINSNKKKRRRGKGTRRKGKQTQQNSGGRSTKVYGKNKGNPCRTGSIDTAEQRPNKFDDFMKDTMLTATEKSELEEASRSDNENKDVPLTPRTRSSNLVEVECRSCGTQEMISASAIHDINRWKCNNCSSQACD